MGPRPAHNAAFFEYAQRGRPATLWENPLEARMLTARMTQARRILLWLMLAALAAWVTYLAFRGYLSPELLLNFSSAFSC